MNPYRFYKVGLSHVGYGAMGDRLEERLVDRVELRDDAEVAVFAVPPHMVKPWPVQQRAATFTMWETDSVPDVYRLNLRRFDKVLVPSTWNVELFSEHHDNVSLVPLGVDTNVWYPKGVPKGPFRFLTAGSGWERKGLMDVITAFVAADLPDAELVVKMPPDPADQPAKILVPDNVTLLYEALPVEDEVELHRSADCFVSASRGEGFGLLPLQHAALGNVVIGPTHTGHQDFCDLFDYPVSSQPAVAWMAAWPNAGNWWLPDFDEIVDAMRAAYEQGRLHHLTKKKRARRVDGWSWDRSVDVLLDVWPSTGNVVASTSVGTPKMTVEAVSNVYADIGRWRLRAVKGERFDVPVETVQQLLESGVVREIEGL